jgi:hypothetical protein
MSALTGFQQTRERTTVARFRFSISASASTFLPGAAADPLLGDAPSPPVESDPRGSLELSGELAHWLTVLRQTRFNEAAPSWARTEDVFAEFQPRRSQTARRQADVSNATTTFTAKELDPVQHGMQRTTTGASVLPGDSPTVRIHGLNDEAVAAYLAQHPAAREVLDEAAAVLPEFFDAPVDIVLDVPPDYEGEHVQHLYVRIQTSEDVDQALARKDRFNEEWWWQRMTDAPPTMHFTLEFVE